MSNATGPERAFLDHLRAGRFMIQRSRASGAHVFPPRVAEPGSGARDLEWVEACGLGTVYATTVVRRRPEQGGDYDVVLVDLDEGPRMMSTVLGIEPTAVRIGLRVKARIDAGGDTPRVVFEPSTGGEAP